MYTCISHRYQRERARERERERERETESGDRSTAHWRNSHERDTVHSSNPSALSSRPPSPCPPALTVPGPLRLPLLALCVYVCVCMCVCVYVCMCVCVHARARTCVRMPASKNSSIQAFATRVNAIGPSSTKRVCHTITTTFTTTFTTTKHTSIQARAKRVNAIRALFHKAFGEYAPILAKGSLQEVCANVGR